MSHATPFNVMHLTIAEPNGAIWTLSVTPISGAAAAGASGKVVMNITGNEIDAAGETTGKETQILLQRIV